jgi:hypothetical protein
MSWSGKFLVKHLQSLILAGEILDSTTAGTTNNIKVLEYDSNHNIRRAEGTDVPVDTTKGYAKGCLFIDTDVAAGTTGLYVNVGTTAECDFDAVSDA